MGLSITGQHQVWPIREFHFLDVMVGLDLSPAVEELICYWMRMLLAWDDMASSRTTELWSYTLNVTSTPISQTQ